MDMIRARGAARSCRVRMADTCLRELSSFNSQAAPFARQVHESHPQHTPIAIHVSYHQQPAAHMRALLARYADGERKALVPLLTERVAPQDRDWCRGSRVRSSAAISASRLAQFVGSHGPWSWSGMSPLQFRPSGKLDTPWGEGSWGVLGEATLFADFVGNRHNLRFDLPSMARFTSARCGDAEPVIGKLLGVTTS